MSAPVQRLQTRVPADGEVRHDWSDDQALALFALPFADLMFRAQGVHRANFDPNRIQLSALLSIKTGGCSEDCGYCAQSARHGNVEAEKILPLDEVLTAARQAKAGGATRFCMGAAWRGPKERDLAAVLPMIEGVKALGLETCVTLGFVDAAQAGRLKAAGLDYYNHNLDTSEAHYGAVVTTHGYQDRMDTLARLRDTGIKLCTGGIVGLGESRTDRAAMLRALANLPRHPESVPINLLVPVAGTPLAQSPSLDVFELVRTVAVARLMMPASYVRLSAGRQEIGEPAQALCFLAGANSIFRGGKLLTTPNVAPDADVELFARLGLAGEQHLEGSLGDHDHDS